MLTKNPFFSSSQSISSRFTCWRGWVVCTGRFESTLEITMYRLQKPFPYYVYGPLSHLSVVFSSTSSSISLKNESRVEELSIWDMREDSSEVSSSSFPWFIKENKILSLDLSSKKNLCQNRHRRMQTNIIDWPIEEEGENMSLVTCSPKKECSCKALYRDESLFNQPVGFVVGHVLHFLVVDLGRRIMHTMFALGINKLK